MNLPVFSALKNKMQWHQARQGVLAENIANAATPGYVAKDIAQPGRGVMSPAPSGQGSSFASFVTHPKHIQLSPISSSGFGGAKASDSLEITPDENSVVLEEQMMKIAGNQMDYQAATSLYSSNLGLIRTAIGSRGQ
ncbi:MAG: flagellar basal-body rod protein FlgB [Pseudomonadota bacterium]